MQEQPMLEIDIDGVKIPVTVTEEGRFVATLEGSELGESAADLSGFASDTLSGLRWQLRGAIVARRVEVPFVSTDGRRGVMRGYHAGTHDILTTMEDGSKGKMSTHARVWKPDEISEEQIVALKLDLLAEAQLRQRIDSFQGMAPNRASDLLAEALGEDVTKR